MRAGKVVMFDLGGVLVENTGAAGLAALLPAPLEPGELWRRWLGSPTVRAFERGYTAPEEFAAAFIDEWGLALEPAAFLDAFAGWPRGLYQGADALLRDYRPRYLGVDVDLLFAAGRAARYALQAGERPEAPVLTLSLARVRGSEPELPGGMAGPPGG